MPDYISVPIVADPDAMAATVYAAIQAVFPGWEPHPGNPEVVMIQGLCQVASEDATLATAQPTSIFRYAGPLFGVSPLDAAPASVGATVTVQDDSGYTIFAGTVVGIAASGDTLVNFAVLTDVTIPPGSTTTATGEVTLRAINAGSAGSGLGGDSVAATLVDQLAFVTSVILTGVTTGGVDAETDATFLNRLRTELQLLTPRPIVPSDFAAIALNTPGVSRAVAIDLYAPPVNEIETVTVNGTGGTFKLTFESQQTGTIAWNAAASVVQTALEALSNIAPGDVLVTGGPLATAPVTVQFKGAYAGTNVTQMTADSTSLSGGSHTASIATTTGGAASSDDNERTISVALVDAVGNTVPDGTKAAIAAQLEALREVNFVVNVIDPIRTTIDVTYTATAQPGQDPAAVDTSIQAAIAAFLNPATWGAVQGDQFSWVDDQVVRYLALSQAIGNAFGVAHVDTVGLCLGGGSPGTSDITMDGPASLPVAGSVTGTTS